MPSKNLHPTCFPTALQLSFSVQPLRLGFIDVTKAPYSAMGDGVTDDTLAIQTAMNDAYQNNLIVYLPEGTYIVTKGLTAVSCFVSRKFAYQLMGSTTGTSRPVIKLRDNSVVEHNVLLLFQLFASCGSFTFDPNGPLNNAPCLFGATVRGIDFDMGNNPTVRAISMDGAQHSTIQDVKIYGENYHIGVFNVPGSGGSIVNLEVFGGRIGIFQGMYRPNPTITGLTLFNQSAYGVLLVLNRGPLIITGFNITGPLAASSSYRAISLSGQMFSLNLTREFYNRMCPSTGGIALQAIVEDILDVSLQAVPSSMPYQTQSIVLSDGTIDTRGGSWAIEKRRIDAVLNNVWVKAAKITDTLVGSSSQWQFVNRYVYTDIVHGSIFRNGSLLSSRLLPYEYIDRQVPSSSMPPETIYTTTMHVWGNMPSWNDSNILNVVDFGATPEFVNRLDNDGVAIQAAIDASTTSQGEYFGYTVFLPRGHFHITSPLILRSGLKLVGAGKFISVIEPLRQWNNSIGPIISSEDNAAGSLILSDFAIRGYHYMTYMHLKLGNIVCRDIATETNVIWNINGVLNRKKVPYLMFSGGSSGKIYNLAADHIIGGAPALPLSSSESTLLLSIRGTSKPLTFYQLSVENLEENPQMVIGDAQNVTIFGFKFELNSELLHINDSSSIRIVGGSGNYQLERSTDTAIIVINRCSNVEVENLVRKSYSSSDVTEFWLVNDITRETVTGNAYNLLYYRSSP